MGDFYQNELILGVAQGHQLAVGGRCGHKEELTWDVSCTGAQRGWGLKRKSPLLDLITAILQIKKWALKDGTVGQDHPAAESGGGTVHPHLSMSPCSSPGRGWYHS